MNKKEVEEISAFTRKRYSDRYKVHRHGIQTLGWGSKEMQEYRFEQVFNHVDPAKKSVLDIGCGFGDLHNYLKTKNAGFSQYHGWDINPDLIKDALIDSETAELKVFDIALNAPDKAVADIGVMLGLLNWNLKSEEKNYAYSMQLISNAFKAVNEVLVVDFLSTFRTPDYPKEDFVFYHEPLETFKMLQSLTSNIDMVHSYAPIPQKEFMLYLYK